MTDTVTGTTTNREEGMVNHFRGICFHRILSLILSVNIGSKLSFAGTLVYEGACGNLVKICPEVIRPPFSFSELPRSIARRRQRLSILKTPSASIVAEMNQLRLRTQAHRFPAQGCRTHPVLPHKPTAHSRDRTVVKVVLSNTNRASAT